MAKLIGIYGRRNHRRQLYPFPPKADWLQAATFCRSAMMVGQTFDVGI